MNRNTTSTSMKTIRTSYGGVHTATRAGLSTKQRRIPQYRPQGRPTLPFHPQRLNKLQVVITKSTASGAWLNEPLKHVIESQQFDKEALAEIFRVSRDMEDIRPNTDESRQLQGRIMSTLFYEPSTRTRLSFESAMARLGGTVLSTESAGEYSSAAKGETLEDTIRTVEGYADTIVLRHFQAGSARKAANAASVPIINAGDGPGQHPTQALLDVYTIQREIGRLDNFSIGMVGDLANGRTVRSLAYVLSMYDNVKMYFVAPDVVRMKPDITSFLTEQGVEWEEVEDLKAVASDVDVLYQTRIQKERFQDRPDDYEKAKGKYIIDQEVMKLLPRDGVIMHPLPRVDEIDPLVDDDPRAAYFRQARNGLYVRMALLKLALLV
jgi:aspartate carbamoyltransferase catalytic subunit